MTFFILIISLLAGNCYAIDYGGPIVNTGNKASNPLYITWVSSSGYVFGSDGVTIQDTAGVFSIKPSSGTLQGNVFNGPSQLIQLNGSGQYPALDGSLITGINAGDNLGNHIATTTLLMGSNAIISSSDVVARTLTFSGNTLPTTLGPANYRLVADGLGNVSWLPSAAAAGITYVTDGASPDVSGYLQFVGIQDFVPAERSTVTVATVLFNQYLSSVATNVGHPGLTYIPAGTWRSHFHAKAGNANRIKVTVEIYIRTVGGLETDFCSSEESPYIATSETEYDLYSITSGTAIASTSRIVRKIKATTVDGPATSIELYANGIGTQQTNTRLEMPSSIVDMTQFVPYNNANQVTNHGAYGILTSSNISANIYQIAGSSILFMTAGETSLSIGKRAGGLNTVGGNIFIGQDAGRINVIGASNTVVGYEAGFTNNLGVMNTFMGFQSGRSHTQGASNTFYGAESGYSQQYGDGNTYFGRQAGFVTVTGAGNSCLGTYSCRQNNSGNYNIAVGYSGGYNNSLSQNVWVGYESGKLQTTATDNAYLGYQAGLSNQTGRYNTLMGSWSGKGVTSNSFWNNTYLGYQSGFATTTGSSNTIVGANSGKAITTASSNTIIGTNAGTTLTTGLGNILIGPNVDVPYPSTSTWLNIGGAIYGDISGAASSTITFVSGVSVEFVVDRTPGPKNEEEASRVVNSVKADGKGGIIDAELDPTIRETVKLQVFDRMETKTRTVMGKSTAPEYLKIVDEHGMPADVEIVETYQSPVYKIIEKPGRNLSSLVSSLAIDLQEAKKTIKDLQSRIEKLENK